MSKQENKMEMTEVFRSLAQERSYQEEKWGESSKSSVSEYLHYMQHYINKAVASLSTDECIDVCDTVLSQIRKVTALGVACGEQHGFPRRGGHTDSYLFVRGEFIIADHDGGVYQCIAADNYEAVFAEAQIQEDNGNLLVVAQYSNLFAVSNFKIHGRSSFGFKRTNVDDLVTSFRSFTENSKAESNS